MVLEDAAMEALVCEDEPGERVGDRPSSGVPQDEDSASSVYIFGGGWFPGKCRGWFVVVVFLGTDPSSVQPGVTAAGLRRPSSLPWRAFTGPWRAA